MDGQKKNPDGENQFDFENDPAQDDAVSTREPSDAVMFDEDLPGQDEPENAGYYEEDPGQEYMDQEEDFYEEGWEEPYSPGEDEEAQPAARKDRGADKPFWQKHFNSLLIGGAVLVGLVFVYNSVVGGKPAANRAANPAPQATGLTMGQRDVVYGAPQTAPAESAPGQPADSQDLGFLMDPGKLDQPGADAGTASIEQPQLIDNAPPMPSPVAPMENAGEPFPPQGLMTAEPDVVMEPQAPAAAAPLPSFTAPSQTQPSSSAPQQSSPPALAAVPEISAPAASVDTEARAQMTRILEQLSALNQRFDALEGQVSGVRKEIDTVKSSDSATPSAPAGEATAAQLKEIEDLKASVQSLQRRIETMSAVEAKPARRSSSEAKSAKPKAVTQNRSANTDNEETRKAARNARTTQNLAAQPQAKALDGGWELRSARPGRAWVAQAGSQTVKAVAIGDNLPGIGTITSIGFVGGQWVIQGTSGRIAQ